MKRIAQFRYYGRNRAGENYGTSYDELTRGNIFEQYGNISQMGIQAPRGTKFFLNNGNQYPIIIGDTGIYEIDLQDHGHIYAIEFEKASIDVFDKEGSTGRLLIDIIYEGAGASV